MVFLQQISNFLMVFLQQISNFLMVFLQQIPNFLMVFLQQNFYLSIVFLYCCMPVSLPRGCSLSYDIVTVVLTTLTYKYKLLVVWLLWYLLRHSWSLKLFFCHVLFPQANYVLSTRNKLLIVCCYNFQWNGSFLNVVRRGVWQPCNPWFLKQPWNLKKRLEFSKNVKIGLEFVKIYFISFFLLLHGNCWSHFYISNTFVFIRTFVIRSAFITYTRTTISQDLQTWFSVQLAFAKFLSKIKGYF